MKSINSFPNNFSVQASHPLCPPTFFQLLERSESIGPGTGWTPLYFYNRDAILPSFIKSHSYGEYIFDWSWAHFYEQQQQSYYPKLIHALPFTPVNAPKLWGEKSHYKKLIQESFEFYQENQILSSEHYLFVDKELSEILKSFDFSTMKTIQYHWQNQWESFDHFLSELTPNRRKMIKKERRKAKESDLEIVLHRGKGIDEGLMQEVYQLYLSTITKKHSYAYLTEAFFIGLANEMSDQVLIYTARKKEEIIAMSLFFVGSDTLYGRYWGIAPNYESLYPALHFELCYYRGIDYCFENKLKTFEAGAQGEHKLWRGFKPVEILSSHHLRTPQFFNIIRNAIMKQNKQTEQEILRLESYLPYQTQ